MDLDTPQAIQREIMTRLDSPIKQVEFLQKLGTHDMQVRMQALDGKEIR